MTDAHLVNEEIYTPFSGPHDVVVQLLVEVVEQRDCLNDHRVDLVRTELQLVA